MEQPPAGKAARSEPAHGLVGMDVLRGTVLTVSGDPDRPVLWQVASS